MDEQAEQSLDPGPAAAQVLAHALVLERPAPGLEEVFAAGDLDQAAATVGGAARLERARPTARTREAHLAGARGPRPLGDRDHLAGRAGDRAVHRARLVRCW